MSIRDVAIVWILYSIVCALAFTRLSPQRAVAISYLGGWLLLPVGVFPPGMHGFTVSLIGGALPAANMLITKAWIAPTTTLALALVFAPQQQQLSRRFGWVDLPISLWCVWPLLAGIGAVDPSPQPIVSTLYIAGTWGAPWLLGKMFYADADSRKLLIETVADIALVVVPAAWAEGICSPLFYTLFYGDHPLVADGAVRYIGYRPLLFMEDGNQYGMVIAMAALAAIAARRWTTTRFANVRAAVLLATAFLSQSVGAIMLLAAGSAVLLDWISLAAVRKIGLGVALSLAVIGPVYVSGIVPVDGLIRQTTAGNQILNLVRATGRGSIAWRVAQDLRVLPLLRAHPSEGTSRWDWWRQKGTRPWGLGLLIVGQFGLAGTMFAVAAWLLPAVRALSAKSTIESDDACIGLALIVALTAIDGLLNSFVYLPAVSFAAVIATRRMTRTSTSQTSWV